MRVGIYNRWIDALGGGEQTLGAFASVLAEDHDVEIITHDPPQWAVFEDVLGLDLRGATAVQVPFDRDHYRPVQDLTRGYDLFVNCSYLDHVRAFARCNAMQVFFPPEPPEPGHRALAPYERRTDGPRCTALGGLHPLERDEHGPFAWSDGRGRFLLDGTTAGRPVVVELVVGGARPGEGDPVSVHVTADGTEVLAPTVLVRPGHHRLRVEVVPGDGPCFVELRSADVDDPAPRRGTGGRRIGVRVGSVAVVDGPAAPAPAPGPRRSSGAGLGRWSDRARFDDAVGSYQLLLANSHFTQRWIGRRYGRASELLYPPVQVGQFAPGPKLQRIISVGRFFVEGHSKKQLEMIGVFRRLHDDGLAGWEYHLVGGTTGGPEARAYFERCRAAAEGYPVHLHPDAPLRDLAALYSGSTLCWNATGLGQDPDTDPDRFEHFGMTTVEAMASGCIPVSLARAGQPEIIEHDVSGILWEDLDELARHTLALAADPERCAVLAAGAVRRSADFTFDGFRTRLRQLVAEELRSR